jgi:hypothetical protein
MIRYTRLGRPFRAEPHQAIHEVEALPNDRICLIWRVECVSPAAGFNSCGGHLPSDAGESAGGCDVHMPKETPVGSKAVANHRSSPPNAVRERST